jgi:hypothetical protein
VVSWSGRAPRSHSDIDQCAYSTLYIIMSYTKYHIPQFGLFLGAAIVLTVANDSHCRAATRHSQAKSLVVLRMYQKKQSRLPELGLLLVYLSGQLLQT